MSAAPVPGPYDDDLMAVADTAGVNASPSIRTCYTDADYAAVLATWARKAAPPFTIDTSIDQPIPYALADNPVDLDLEHAGCDGTDCGRRLCLCEDALCPGHVQAACPHLNLLCDHCLGQCPECVVDGQHDAGIDR